MVASLLMSARSRRLTSVTSRISTTAPELTPRGRNGTARSSTVARRASASMRIPMSGYGPSGGATTPAATSIMVAAS
ncbi:Uncharacterised protein [Mycobacteroides abscessus subsp. abscessus]|nr:Uncharacterised protein [Mycobacteroides abscessus subsp. abscessus]